MKTSERLAAAVAYGRRLFRAPGRVNIIGEHTDYSDGLVLPTNTGLYTWVTASPRSDREIHVIAENFNASCSFDIDEIEPGACPGWIDYVKGVARELADAGVALVGADLSIDGEIPIGGGLSSSASLELGVASALLGLTGQHMPPARVARVCQAAEHRYAGVNCGIMDQLSGACGMRAQAMLLDCRSLEAEFVGLPDDLALIVTDSGVKHELAGSGYNDRHNECREAVRLLREADPAIGRLRDASPDLLQREQARLGELLYRRARHVVTEIRRVRDAYAALGTGDLEYLGALISESHASLRDDFDVSCEEIESLVCVADACKEVLGSRMVGGGFGGCVLSVARRKDVQDAMENICESYGRITGATPWIHTVTPASPAGEVTTT